MTLLPVNRAGPTASEDVLVRFLEREWDAQAAEAQALQLTPSVLQGLELVFGARLRSMPSLESLVAHVHTPQELVEALRTELPQTVDPWARRMLDRIPATPTSTALVRVEAAAPPVPALDDAVEAESGVQGSLDHDHRDHGEPAVLERVEAGPRVPAFVALVASVIGALIGVGTGLVGWWSDVMHAPYIAATGGAGLCAALAGCWIGARRGTERGHDGENLT